MSTLTPYVGCRNWWIGLRIVVHLEAAVADSGDVATIPNPATMAARTIATARLRSPVGRLMGDFSACVVFHGLPRVAISLKKILISR